MSPRARIGRFDTSLNNGRPNLFSNNATVTRNRKQAVNLLGVMYFFKFESAGSRRHYTPPGCRSAGGQGP